MKKKGFTLVEIIVCIVLLAVIATISIVTINSNNKDEEKIISEVVAAADVYYNSAETLKTKLEDNYGYLVITLNELKESGIISTNDENINNLIATGENYEKVIIVNSKDNKDTVVSANNELGLLDIIYPYVENTPFTKDLENVVIEYNEADNFKCNSLLDSGIEYLNKDYQKQKSTNFTCEFNGTSFNTTENLSLNKDSEILTENEVNYKIQDVLDVPRIVFVNPEYTPEFVKKTIESDSDYVCGEWTKESVRLSIVEDNLNFNDSNVSYKWFVDGVENENNSNLFNMTETGSIKGSYDLIGKINGTSIKNGDYTCEVKIDKEAPTIDMSTTKSGTKVNLKITFKDTGGSNLDSYYISTTKLTNTSSLSNKLEDNPSSKTVNLDSVEYGTKYYIYTKDKAGNLTLLEDYEVKNDTPSIEVIPIEGTFTKFKVKIKDPNKLAKINDLYDIKIQYEYDDYLFENSYKNTNYLNKFKENYKYNDAYDTSKKNYIDYSKMEDVNCNDTECTFTIDMDDQITDCGNTNYCRYYVIDELNNYNLKYYIKVKNSLNKEIEFKFNSKINIKESTDIYTSREYHASSTRYYGYIKGYNNNRDLLILETRTIPGGCGNVAKNYLSYYYYDNKNHELKQFASYSTCWYANGGYYSSIQFNNSGKYTSPCSCSNKNIEYNSASLTINGFNEQNIYYTFIMEYNCPTWGCFFGWCHTKYNNYQAWGSSYKYDLTTNKSTAGAIVRSDINDNYISTSYTKYDPNKYIITYTNRMYTWIKNNYTPNDKSMAKTRNVLNGNVYLEKDGSYSILMEYKQYTSKIDYIGWYKLSFKPTVTITYL